MSEPTTPNIQLVRNGAVPCIYIEGLSQIMLGFPNSRVMLHNMVTKDSPDAPETQHLALELVMPTVALLEMCRNVLQHTAHAAPQIKEVGEQWMETVNRIVDSAVLDAG